LVFGCIFRIFGDCIADKCSSTNVCICRSNNGWFKFGKRDDKRHSTDSCNHSKLCGTFFRRPKPVIRDQPFINDSGFVRVNVFGADLGINARDVNELWISVSNVGQTAIKRLRARATIVNLRHPSILSPPGNRPENMSVDDWNRHLQERQRMHDRIEREFSEGLFGRALPFSRTPRGTTAFQWAQVDGRESFEVDLAPNNDEASVKLAAIYRLDDIESRQAINSGRVRAAQGTRIVSYTLGSMTGSALNPTFGDGIAHEVAVKFWLIAENLTEEVSEIFHVEIPESFNTINSTRYDRNSKSYRELNKWFSL
jgi:hypothetical protein